MEKKIIITTPYPTIEETAKKFGVPLSRVREIVDSVDRRRERMKKADANRAKKRVNERKARIKPSGE